MPEFEIQSALSTDADTLWRHSTSPRGVNTEFWPLLRMTFPPGTVDFADSWQPGVRLFRSWILLFGLIPIDYDDITFVEIDPGRRFLERSSMATQRVWQHERTLTPLEAGTRITDRIVFEPRVSAFERLQRLVYNNVFRYRHYRLKSLFGSAAVQQGAAVEGQVR